MAYVYEDRNPQIYYSKDLMTSEEAYSKLHTASQMHDVAVGNIASIEQEILKYEGIADTYGKEKNDILAKPVMTEEDTRRFKVVSQIRETALEKIKRLNRKVDRYENMRDGYAEKMERYSSAYDDAKRREGKA